MSGEQAEFLYERFLVLSGPPLWQYLDECDISTVPAGIAQQLMDAVDLLDEEHLVAAITILESCARDEFLPRVPAYLAHQSRSVRLAASRYLVHLPAIPEFVFDDVKRFAPSCPEDGMGLLAELAQRVM